MRYEDSGLTYQEWFWQETDFGGFFYAGAAAAHQQTRPRRWWWRLVPAWRRGRAAYRLLAGIQETRDEETRVATARPVTTIGDIR